MTDKFDNFEQREKIRGKGVSEADGLVTEAFADPTGTYPRQEDLYDTTVSKESRGIIHPELNIGGGDINVPIDLNDQQASEYPYAQVKKTSSGHYIIYDDTPGGERILLLHRTGAGVELRSDGSVVVSSTKNTIQVSGADHSMIVEGDGKLSYKGNLNLHVAGDYSVDVGGNYNVNCANRDISINGSNRERVTNNSSSTVTGNRDQTTLGIETILTLSDKNIIVKGNLNEAISKSLISNAGQSIITTAETEISQASDNINIAANDISVFGSVGTIGGDNVIMYNRNMYSSKSVYSQTITTNVVYGDLQGTATKSITSDITNSQPYHEAAQGSAVGYTTDNTSVDNTATTRATTIIMSDYLNNSSKGIKQVTIDLGEHLFNAIDRSVDYNGVSNKQLSITEVRSKLKNKASFDDDIFTSRLISEGVLSENFKDTIPPSIGRSYSRKNPIIFGINKIGNNPTQTSTKRFK